MTASDTSSSSPNHRYATLCQLTRFWRHEEEALWTPCPSADAFPLNESDYARGEWKVDGCNEPYFELNGARYRFAARIAVRNYERFLPEPIAGRQVVRLYKHLSTLKKAHALLSEDGVAYRAEAVDSVAEKGEWAFSFYRIGADASGAECCRVPLSCFDGEDRDEDERRAYPAIEAGGMLYCGDECRGNVMARFFPVCYLCPGYADELLRVLNREKKLIHAVMNNRSLRSVFAPLVGMYSETAHFVYELLQNADDAEASYVRFELRHNGLLVAHNGKRRFTVTDWYLDELDRDATPGHINAITSVGDTSKTDDGKSIGKFGIGFKSVYGYTGRPQVYDDDFHFYITSEIIPGPKEQDFEGRLPGETLFWLPFEAESSSENRPNTEQVRPTPQGACREIAMRLRTLEYPTLFLRCLRRVSYRITPEAAALANGGRAEAGARGEYAAEDQAVEAGHGLYEMPEVEEDSMTGKDSATGADITGRLLTYRICTNGEEHPRRLWKFSRPIGGGPQELALAFFLEERRAGKADRLRAEVGLKAFCYFPTKLETGLNFAIHIPFQLVFSREHVNSDRRNTDMLRQLAQMAGDCLPLLAQKGLVGEDILNIIPLSPEDRSGMPFHCFHDSILAAMRRYNLIPGGKGTFCRAEWACWTEEAAIRSVFDAQQLEKLLGFPVCWAFPSVKTGKEDHARREYVERLLGEENILTLSGLIKRFTHGFTRSFCSPEWLREKLYPRIGANRLVKPEEAKKYPIFFDTEGRSCSAVEDGVELRLYSEPAVPEVRMLHRDLFADEEGKRLVAAFGFKHAEKQDYVNTLTKGKYGAEPSRTVSKDENLKLIGFVFGCYREDKVQGRELIESLIIKPVLRCYPVGQPEKEAYRRGKQLYLPTKELRRYFCDGWKRAAQEEIMFVRLEDYSSLCTKAGDKELLREFFCAFGVRTQIQLIEEEGARSDWRRLKANFPQCSIIVDKLTRGGSKDEHSWKYLRMPGLERLLSAIQEGNKEYRMMRSALLWNELCRIRRDRDDIPTSCLKGNYKVSIPEEPHKKLLLGYDFILGVRCVIPGSRKVWSENGDGHWEMGPFLELGIPEDIRLLRKTAWLLNSRGEAVRPGEISQEELRAVYKVQPSDMCARELMDFLGVRSERKDNLSPTEQCLAGIGDALGLDASTPEGLLALQEKVRQMVETAEAAEWPGAAAGAAATKELPAPSSRAASPATSHHHSAAAPAPLSAKERKEKWEALSSRSNAHVAAAIVSPQDETSQQACAKPPLSAEELLLQQAEEREKLKQKHLNNWMRDDAEMCVRHVHEEEANRCPRYSFGWFKSLLELEGEVPDGKPLEELSISFSRVEHMSTDTLLLTSPDREVPAELREHRDIPLQLEFGPEHKNVLVLESVGVLPDRIKARIKHPEKALKLDMSAVHKATIHRKNPIFLVGELARQFQKLPYPDEANLLSAEYMPRDIRFVYGPPGTGKTTYLIRHVLTETEPHAGAEQPVCKTRLSRILVLTPTNKAADVIARGLLHSVGKGSRPCIRFGGCEDEELKEAGLCHDRSTLTESELDRPLITTIARLPYDTVGGRLLCELDWELVVMDEASMIPLYQAVFTLLRLRPRGGFIIAGDPKQIGPITKANEWEGQNIYTAVELDSFSHPATKPHPYEVIRLMTQYRSVPAIGELYSRYTYDSLLSHHRQETQWRPLGSTAFAPLNLLHIPVEQKVESLYKCKTLAKSPYHIYSALFAHELAQYLAHQWEMQAGESFCIGIITAYRAQKELIEKLQFSAPPLPEKVSIVVGTVHGFQGDQCDAIIAVLNPSPGASSGAMLNNGTILNVAISRAQDYLLVLAPYRRGSLQPFGSLHELERLKNDMYRVGGKGNLRVFTDSHALEEIMRGNRHYLEQNTYLTAHHPVNLYAETTHLYELRCTENAIDIQVDRPERRGTPAPSPISRNKPEAPLPPRQPEHPGPLPISTMAKTTILPDDDFVVVNQNELYRLAEYKAFLPQDPAKADSVSSSLSCARKAQSLLGYTYHQMRAICMAPAQEAQAKLEKIRKELERNPKLNSNHRTALRKYLRFLEREIINRKTELRA